MASETIVGMAAFIFLLIYWASTLDPKEHKLPKGVIVLLVPWMLTILIGLMMKYEECVASCDAKGILLGIFWGSATISLLTTLYSIVYVVFNAVKSIKAGRESYQKRAA